jgi:hypothetical protein
VSSPVEQRRRAEELLARARAAKTRKEKRKIRAEVDSVLAELREDGYREQDGQWVNPRGEVVQGS